MPSLQLWLLTSFLSAPGWPNRPQVPTSSPCAPCQPSSWPDSSHKQWVRPSPAPGPSLGRQQSPWSPGSSLGLPSPVSQPLPALPGLPSYLPSAHLPDGPPSSSLLAPWPCRPDIFRWPLRQLWPWTNTPPPSPAPLVPGGSLGLLPPWLRSPPSPVS